MDLKPWMLLLCGADRFQKNAIPIISSLQNAKLLWQVQPRRQIKAPCTGSPLD